MFVVHNQYKEYCQIISKKGELAVNFGVTSILKHRSAISYLDG